MVANGVKHPPEGCHPEGIEGSGFDEGVGRRKGRDVSTPLDMTGILIIRVHPWLARGSTTRKEAKTAQNGGRTYEKREIHENGAETGLKNGGQTTNYANDTNMGSKTQSVSIRFHSWLDRGSSDRKEARMPPKWPLGAENGLKMAKMGQKCPKTAVFGDESQRGRHGNPRRGRRGLQRLIPSLLGAGGRCTPRWRPVRLRARKRPGGGPPGRSGGCRFTSCGPG